MASPLSLQLFRQAQNAVVVFPEPLRTPITSASRDQINKNIIWIKTDQTIADLCFDYLGLDAGIILRIVQLARLVLTNQGNNQAIEHDAINYIIQRSRAVLLAVLSAELATSTSIRSQPNQKLAQARQSNLNQSEKSLKLVSADLEQGVRIISQNLDQRFTKLSSLVQQLKEGRISESIAYTQWNALLGPVEFLDKLIFLAQSNNRYELERSDLIALLLKYRQISDLTELQKNTYQTKLLSLIDSVLQARFRYAADCLMDKVPPETLVAHIEKQLSSNTSQFALAQRTMVPLKEKTLASSLLRMRIRTFLETIYFCTLVKKGEINPAKLMALMFENAFASSRGNLGTDTRPYYAGLMDDVLYLNRTKGPFQGTLSQNSLTMLKKADAEVKRFHLLSKVSVTPDVPLLNRVPAPHQSTSVIAATTPSVPLSYPKLPLKNNQGQVLSLTADLLLERVSITTSFVSSLNNNRLPALNVHHQLPSPSPSAPTSPPPGLPPKSGQGQVAPTSPAVVSSQSTSTTVVPSIAAQVEAIDKELAAIEEEKAEIMAQLEKIRKNNASNKTQK